MYPTTQLAECWMNTQSTGNLSIITLLLSYSPTSPSYLMPPTYAVRGYDHNDGPYEPQYIASPQVLKEEMDEEEEFLPLFQNG
ncbi:Hypothetical protein CINCED_3A015665, partial [Cinara cedri]